MSENRVKICIHGIAQRVRRMSWAKLSFMAKRVPFSFGPHASSRSLFSMLEKLRNKGKLFYSGVLHNRWSCNISWVEKYFLKFKWANGTCIFLSLIPSLVNEAALLIKGCFLSIELSHLPGSCANWWTSLSSERFIALYGTHVAF